MIHFYICVCTILTGIAKSDMPKNESFSNQCLSTQHCTDNICDTNYECSHGCQPGYSGRRCLFNCSSGCTNSDCIAVGSEEGYCTEGCKDGYWGDKCSKPCSVTCKACAQHDGSVCSVCKDEYHYGTACHLSCQSDCTDTGCNMDGGCRKQCHEGNNDKDCLLPCSIYCEDECFQANGTCKYKCKRGYYGVKCDSICSKYCLNAECDRKSGDCTTGCAPGFYGARCVYNCTHCKFDHCHQTTGECSVACKNGFYKRRCNKRCHHDCFDRICNRDTGFCIHGNRSEAAERTAPSGNNIVVSVFIGTCALLLCCVLSGILFFRFWKRGSHQQRNGYLDTALNLSRNRYSHDYNDIHETEMDPSEAESYGASGRQRPVFQETESITEDDESRPSSTAVSD